jgi:transcriptional adapter 2-alpha
MVEVYNMRLDERAARRSFILERGLLNVKRTQAAERRRTPEERELAARCRVLARFHSPAEHEALLEGLACEARLRARAEELKEWRRAGITSLAEGDAYEAEKRRRANERARLRAAEGAAAAASAAAAVAAGKPVNARSNRYLSRDGSGVLVMPPPGEAGAGAKGGGAGGAGGAGAGAGGAAGGAGAGLLLPSLSSRRPKAGTFLDLTGLPGAELLTGRERELCSVTRLVPVHYLAVKEGMLRAYARDGALRRADARSLFRLDAHRSGAVYDLLVCAGWIAGDAGGRVPRASTDQLQGEGATPRADAATGEDDDAAGAADKR